MITSEVARALEVIRADLDERTRLDDPVSGMYRVGRPLAEVVTDLPQAYIDLLRVANGGKIGAFQFLSSQEMRTARIDLDAYPDSLNGLELELLCEVGVYVDAPVAVLRGDGSVWSFPDLSKHWWMDQVIERVAPDLDAYLRGWVFNRSKAIEHGEEYWLELLDQNQVNSLLPLSD